MQDNEPIIRPLDYAQDREALRAFLDAADQSRLDQIRPALADGDGFALVAEAEGRAVGWVVVHNRYRDDLGWEPDGNTRRFQNGGNAYVENLAAEPGSRNRGMGRLLLAAAALEASRRGKRCLWLHASETNEGACRFYERGGWSHHSTVHPVWRQGRAMRVYSKAIDQDRSCSRGGHAMITITNPKVSGFVPRWARFRGFSLLFDNPGDSLIRSGDRLDLRCDVEADPELAFYRRLRDSLECLDPVRLTKTYLFCPLPPASYHVTVWDGGNDGNVAQVFSAQRPRLEALLAGLPGSLSQPNDLVQMAASSSLARKEGWNLRFGFDRLVNWGNTVIVARLCPADEASTRALNELVEERRRLTFRFRAAFGIGPGEAFSPHVSLGYFANRETAELAAPSLEEWNHVFEKQMQDLTLALTRVSLYGFTDMASFFRAAGAD